MIDFEEWVDMQISLYVKEQVYGRVHKRRAHKRNAVHNMLKWATDKERLYVYNFFNINPPSSNKPESLQDWVWGLEPNELDTLYEYFMMVTTYKD